jgi:hypothetical protein
MTLSVASPAGRRATIGALGLLACACGSQDDLVFQVFAFQLESEPVVVHEGAGVVEIPLRLTHPSSRAISATYQAVKLEAQDDCQVPDFTAATGTVQWAPGTTEASVLVYIVDDQLAETDERFEILLENVTGASTVSPVAQVVVILDDDRSGIVDARAEFGVEPGRPGDQAAALQAAMNRAGAMGRGVVLMAPGDYQISRLSLVPGTTLSARGVRWHRLPMSPSDTVTLHSLYTGAADSAPTLVEGLFIDGDRDEQGPFRNNELQDAHLMRVEASSDQPGRIHATFEDVSMSESTASAVWIGPNSDVAVCHITAHDMWRDALTLRGGRSSLRLRDLDATASDGTTGIWLGALDVGYQGAETIDAEVEDARFGTGDVEMVLSGGSSVTVRRLSMTQAPFRLVAPDSTVRISDSVLAVGIPSDRHNYWAVPHDVEITGTTLIASAQDENGQEVPGTDRTLVAASVRWGLAPTDPPLPGTHRLHFDQCRFEKAKDVGPTDTVYAVANPTVGGTVLVTSGSLGAGVAGWFAPGCKDCQMEP